MSLRKADKDQFINDNLDGLIRLVLQDSVAGAEPSPQVWERNEQHNVKIDKARSTATFVQHKTAPPRAWLGWLVGAGNGFPVPGDPRSAWQRRLHAFDMRGSLSIMRIVEGKMPAMRIVS